jgi:hypothetical protein
MTTAATSLHGTVLMLGSMEVTEMREDKFWLRDGGVVPLGAEMYDGPSPIPLAEVRKDLPSGWKAERAWYLENAQDGKVNLIPITIITTPTGERLDYFPRLPQKRP